jgi:hypothetical protein
MKIARIEGNTSKKDKIVSLFLVMLTSKLQAQVPVLSRNLSYRRNGNGIALARAATR